MKKLLILSVLIFFIGCQSIQQQQDEERYRQGYNATLDDMKDCGFINVGDDQRFMAIRSKLLELDDKKRIKQVLKAYKLNSEWFKKFISLNGFEEVYRDKTKKIIYGRGTFPLYAGSNTHFVFDFYVFNDVITGLKIYNWRVLGAKASYRPDPWVRNFEDEYIQNYPMYWAVMKKHFQDYFYSHQAEVIEKI